MLTCSRPLCLITTKYAFIRPEDFLEVYTKEKNSIYFFNLLQSKTQFYLFVCFLLKQTCFSKAENSSREYNTGERYSKDHLKLDGGVIQTYRKKKFTKEGKKVLFLLQIMHYVVMVQKEVSFFFFFFI